MLSEYSLVQMRLKSALEMIQATQKEWSDYLADSEQWMGNCVDQDGTFRSDIAPTYKAMKMGMSIRLVKTIMERRKMRTKTAKKASSMILS